jgi:hypothetical protein
LRGDRRPPSLSFESLDGEWHGECCRWLGDAARWELLAETEDLGLALKFFGAVEKKLRR